MRRVPPTRTSPLPPGPPPVRRASLNRSPLQQDGQPLQRDTRIPPVSRKRARENRQRAAMADRRWPDRRDGTVMCGCGRPECHRRADDLHELLSRARGGSITDEANTVPLARECHAEITLGPDWAYKAGLIKHDAPCCEGHTVCARYEDQAGAA